jgi:hypothetical protein
MMKISRLSFGLILFLYLTTAFIIVQGTASYAGGWSWKTPPNGVTLDNGKRAMIFTVHEPIIFTIKGMSATHYKVRDYYGAIVDKGPAATSLTVKPLPPGWYKLYVYGDVDQGDPWGKSVGDACFAVFRADPDHHFPALADKSVPGGMDGTGDQPTRDYSGMGPERLSVQDASKPDDAIKDLDPQVAVDKSLYLPYDPLRKRALMIAFPNGTKDIGGVRKIVEHFQNDVEYWEPRNEPNGGSSGADFANNEMKPFYDTVKSVNPHLKVMGPGAVTITPAGNLLGWTEDFLKAGGGKSIDAFSFHAYNSVNGDVEMARHALNVLQELLTKYGIGNIEKWQTEQGYFAAVYGSFQPRLQGRWLMDQMMVYEQYGIPKEHNHVWYDMSHGFWDFPTWWENDGGGVNPAVPLLRVWAEELYGTNYTGKFDFGPAGDEQYLGSTFAGPGKNLAIFLSAGDPYGAISLHVNRGTKLHVISPLGVPQDIAVKNGRCVLGVSELPVYVELAPGQVVQPLPMDFGPNLARQSGVTATASGTGVSPYDKNDNNDISKLTNGVLENWYYAQQKDEHPFVDDTWRDWSAAAPPPTPAWVQINIPAATKVDRVVVFAAPPWQSQGSLLDFELQYDDNGQWKTVRTVLEPANTFKVYSSATRTTVDSYYSDRWVFPLTFPSVTTAKIRLLVHDATFGGGATKDVVDAGGQTGLREICLREVEIYGR